MKLLLGQKLFICALLSISFVCEAFGEWQCTEEAVLPNQTTAILSLLKKDLFTQQISEEFCAQLKECYGGYFANVPCSEIEDVTFDEKKTCGLTLQEYIGLSNYSGSLYRCLNQALYAGDGKKFHVLTSTIDSALSKFPRYEGLVIRGASLPQNVLDQHREGEVVEYKGFTSTSTSRRIGEGFREATQGQLFLIYSKSGRPIMGLSTGEEEVLFKSGSKFKVLKAKNGSHFIMREVSDGESESLARVEDRRILGLVEEASKNIPRDPKAADSWKCPSDPQQIPEVIIQRIIPEVTNFIP